eukprot:TRINITY_DN8347_c0_g1_i2.p1 TRINITY_DN8347_c0_g1~~TRINITY_DN8347_c0_g1_i2.p1  ORF type:complete len:288 (+),score=35.79 TRINITY_DN8347_c0_g1_i2:45-908(+)
MIGLLVLVLSSMASVDSDIAVDYVFPERIKWTFDFVMGAEEIQGSGVTLVDWSIDDQKPYYRLEELYEKSTHTDHFKVLTDTISGSSGVYSYSYTTVDGQSGCLPASFTAFPRSIFTKSTWKGQTEYKDATCHKFETSGDATGTPNSVLELLLCNQIPVMVKWTTPSYGGSKVTQTSYTKTFDVISAEDVESQVKLDPSVFSTCKHKKYQRKETTSSSEVKVLEPMKNLLMSAGKSSVSSSATPQSSALYLAVITVAMSLMLVALYTTTGKRTMSSAWSMSRGYHSV